MELCQLAREEVGSAWARFCARAGEERPELSIAFAAAVNGWMQSWLMATLAPDTPIDPELMRAWDESLERARADLELRRFGS